MEAGEFVGRSCDGGVGGLEPLNRKRNSESVFSSVSTEMLGSALPPQDVREVKQEKKRRRFATKCKCGSHAHFRVTHSSCPLNPKYRKQAAKRAAASPRNWNQVPPFWSPHTFQQALFPAAQLFPAGPILMGTLPGVVNALAPVPMLSNSSEPEVDEGDEHLSEFLRSLQ